MGKRAKADKEDVAPPQPLVIEADQYKRTYFGPEEPTLQLECWEEELNEAQIQAHKIADEEYKSIQTKLDDIVQETKGEIVYNGHQFTAYQLLGKQPVLKDLENKSADIIRSRSRSISKEPKEIRRKGRPPKNKRERVPSPSPEPEAPSPEPERSLRKKHKKEQKKEKEKEKEKEKDGSKVKDKTLAPSNVNSVVTNVRPSEATAIGGLATGGGKNTPIVDLTKEDANKDTADSKEVSFNKLQGKTFPSLVVVARPYLRIKEATPSDRSVLDNKVKSVLMHTPTKFTEWLIQQGLVRSEQACAVHIGNKLKLGMYSDVSKFPYSGGYVWISECCPTRFISVFSGSIFEGATHPPSVLLKLVYHWACQTNVQNVVQWVKVDNLYVKGLFTWLRATCTAALHQHLGLMGGAGKKIEVGVISLGTTSHDGTQRQVKVEVLGVLDPVEKTIRLRAVEPLGELEKNYKKRFQKILEPLGNWVHPSSTILTDLTVDKGTLINMGFKTVHQASSSSDPPAKHSNANIMEYLRRIVPRMFQNTLSLLSRQIIQQFLDELVWREKHGITPGQAFDNIVSHIAEQTRFDGKDKLTTRLTKIAANPFKNWKTSGKKKKESEPAELPPPVEDTGRGKRGRKAKKTFSPPPSPPPRKGRKTYVEEDDDDEEMPLAVRKKRIKQEKETKEKEEPKKKTRESRESARESRESTRESRKRDRSYVVDDLDDVPLKAIKKEMKQEEMVVMERFYFGQYGGNDEMPRATIAVKCTTCSKEFNNNCELMRHVFTHIVPPPGASDGETIAQCNYCLWQFATTNDLTIHMKHSHPNDTKIADLFTYACLICEVRFASLTALANHMQKSHAPLELPYRCGRCDFRVSSHRAVVDHFYAAHKEDTCVQCPYCLKIVTVYADGCDLQSNVEHFIEHLSQHQDKELSVKCNRCVLSFVHIGMMKEHQVRSHTSVEEATPLCHEEHQISKPRGKPRPPVKDTASHAMLDTYERLMLHVPDGYLCKECDLHLEHDKHFLGTCRCSKCPFTSSCWRGVLQHSALCAGPNMLESAPRDAPYATHCVCGYSTTVATAMLTHLLACERKSAYPSEDEAKANIKKDEPEPSRDTTSTSKEVEDAVKEAEEPQKDSELGLNESDMQQTTTDQGMSDYPAPPSVLNAQLSLDDLGPPSVIGQNEQNEPELLKHDAYEQPLATPLVRHEQLEQSQYGTLPDFEPLPAEPPPHTEFEPL